MAFYLKDASDRKRTLEAGFYEERRDFLKKEIGNIRKRQEFQTAAVEEMVERELKTRAGEAFALVGHYHGEKAGILQDVEITDMLLGMLRSMNGGSLGSGYFILDGAGRILLDTSSPLFEGRYVADVLDKSETMYFDRLGDVSRSGAEGLYSYPWYRTAEETVRKEMKTGYVRYYPPLNWIIGSSFFQEDIKKELQENFLQTIDYVHAEEPEYFFVRSKDGTILNGQNRGINVFTEEGKTQRGIFLKVQESVEKGDGYLQFPCPHREDLQYLAYAESMDEWNWYIGARITTEELINSLREQKEELRKIIERELLRILLFTLILGLFSFIILRRMGRFLTRDLSLFSEFFHDAARNNVLIDVKRLRFREFIDLGGLANLMLGEKIAAEGERQKYRNLESLGYLAGGIAHDFNNCLMGIYGNIELAQMSMENRREALLFMERALESMEQARGITGRLLTFSHGEKTNPIRFSLLPLLEEKLIPLRKAEGIKLNLDFPGEDVIIRGDKKQIALLLDQVLSNAREALPEGKGRITLRGERESLENSFPCHLSGDFVRLDIEDDGRGVEDDDIYKIFDPYFTTKQVGRGLGLATVFSIIHHHKGHVEARRAYPAGMIISLYFPLPPIEADSDGPG